MTVALDELLDSGGEPHSHKRQRKRRTTTIVGMLCVAIGLGLLGYLGWEYFGTNILAKHRQQQIISSLEEQWSEPGGPSASVEGVQSGAILRIERFGADYAVPIVEGFDDTALSRGVGHLPESAGPGEIGNYALAGHRVTHGEPFRAYMELRAGDEVVVETRRFAYTYVLDDDGDDRTVDFSEDWVLASNPYDPDVPPTDRLITLVTCSELFHSDDRQAVFGHLVSQERKPRP